MISSYLHGLFVLIVLLAAHVARALPCADISSSRAEYIKEHIMDTERSSPDWGNFRPSQIPILILDQAVSQRCAFLIHGPHPIEPVALSQTWQLPISGYDFYPNPYRYQNYPGMNKAPKDYHSFHQYGTMHCCANLRPYSRSFKDFFRSRHLDFVMVYWLPPSRPELKNSSYMAYNASLLLHEAFHFTYQNQAVSNHPWPLRNVFDLVHGTARKDICYHPNPSTSQLLTQEFRALYKALKNRAHPAEMKRWSREFIRLRHQRYGSLQRIPQDQNAFPPFDRCDYHEATWEYLEGTAEFIAGNSLIRSGAHTLSSWTRRAQRQSLRGDKVGAATAYYWSGAAQWFLIREYLGKEAFLKLTRDLSSQHRLVPLYEILHQVMQRSDRLE